MRNRITLSILVLIFAVSGHSSAQTRRPAQGQPVPRLSNGKPDLSGLWDHPFVIDMSKDGENDGCGAAVRGCSQKGPGAELPMTPWAAEYTKNFDPEHDPNHYDATAQCNPLGYTRSMNSPIPTQIIHRPNEIVFLHEAFFAFHVAYLDGRKHPAAEDVRQTTWYGHSIGRWEGDTLVVDTVGPFFGAPMMNLDTRGHPVSDQLHLVERFTRPSYDTLNYEITVADPKAFTSSWKNTRVWKLMPAADEIMEYVCTENNKEVKEGLMNTTPSEKQPPPPK
jgi:hypothetical protein